MSYPFCFPMELLVVPLTYVWGLVSMDSLCTLSCVMVVTRIVTTAIHRSHVMSPPFLQMRWTQSLLVSFLFSFFFFEKKVFLSGNFAFISKAWLVPGSLLCSVVRRRRCCPSL